MATGSIITNNGKNVMLYRNYTANSSLSETQYLMSTKFKVGMDNGTPLIIDTDIDIPIPISNGTVNDEGSNTYCPNCQEIIITRNGYDINNKGLMQNKCKMCGNIIAGRFI